MKHVGLNTHRFKNNPEEERIAKAWDKEAQGKTLAYILDQVSSNGPASPSDRDHQVAASVIQWLGSPVGQYFLKSLGYEKVQS